MLEERQEIIIDNINVTTKTISIAKDTVVLRDGVEITRDRNRCAFFPGQIAEVKAYMGVDDSAPEIVYLNAIWTQEVIDAYNAYLEQLAAQQIGE